MFNGMLRANGRFLAPALMIAGEWQNFVGRRVREDFDLMQRLTRSGTPNQILVAYIDFWQKATEDYGNEIATISKLMTEAATNMTTTKQAAARDTR